jgi:stress-induced morphogen
MAIDTIRTLLAHAFPGADIAVDDCTSGGDHLPVAAVSSAFDGLSLIEQHKLLPCRPRRRWASPPRLPADHASRPF